MSPALQVDSLAAAAKSLQSCLTLCDPMDSSPPGSPVPGILQARTLEWAAISFSNAWKWKVKVKSLSHVRLFATPWTAAHQAPLSMGFSRWEYWRGVPLPSPSAYLGLLIFLLAILNSTCDSSCSAFHMLYSACKLNKQGENIQPCCILFPILNQSVVPHLVIFSYLKITEDQNAYQIKPNFLTQ